TSTLYLRRSPNGHCSTLPMPPTPCHSNDAPPIEPYCGGAAGDDGTRDDVGHLPLGGPRRQLSDSTALFLPRTAVGHAVFGCSFVSISTVLMRSTGSTE